MRPAQLLLNQSKKSGGSIIPVELTPLFLSMGIAVASASYFTYKKFAHDKSLRITKNPELSEVDKVLNPDKSGEKKE
ncbi:ZYBA0S06-02916g1_1 [Zygosaccharomyces bailii CLIB 213]|uniref:ZYBA0S06-02916g1_1 n=1 Tax=Zygosaccharomyces bailii (strain CLIB 213 / ATCC 58445 / CBS 680 / BCRC 21525 / NBRC 1098 / NCYC 1416 / NRRL Y-2227) TaxID=1333698 RepID=A0A8J2T8T7_ZYGB2|nr:ZYBA0S06-02916g1_1 [Zygosaccharomyces bailii CLIB 213]